MEKNEPKVKVEEEAVISIQPEPADFEEIGVKGIESVIVVPPSVETTASRKEPGKVINTKCNGNYINR